MERTLREQALARGFRMPAEWEPHLATYMTWPHNPETWPGAFEPVPAEFAHVVARLSECESVRLLVADPGAEREARALLAAAQARAERLEFLTMATNDSWIRDYGPIFVRPGKGPMLALDWLFNSWGTKYGSVDLDDPIPRRLAAHLGFECLPVPMVLEGGSIEIDGQGTLLTTESCLLNPNRNPGLGRAEIEEHLCVMLGIEKVLWLGEGIAGDDTDGHIDDLARFVAPGVIVTVREDDPADDNYRPLKDNLRRLAAMRDASGRPFQIETLPMPPAQLRDGQRMPASYANFYIANGAVLMPAFGVAADRIARETLAQLFPARRVIECPALNLVWGLGTIHCLTQQHPG